MNIFKNAKSVISATGTDLYTTPVARQAIIHSLFLTNITNAPVRVTVVVGTIKVINSKSILSNDTLILDKTINISKDESLTIIADDGNNTIEAFASIIEGSEGATFIENGIPNLSLVGEELVLDTASTGASTVLVNNITTKEFDPDTNGSVWGTFVLPEPWSRDDNIDIELQYLMQGGFTTKNALLELSVWVLDGTSPFDINNPTQSTQLLLEATTNNIDVIRFDNIGTILDSNLAVTDRTVIVRLKREAFDPTDDYTGTLNVISIGLIPVKINGQFSNIFPNDIIGFNLINPQDKSIIQYNATTSEWEVGPAAATDINSLITGTPSLDDILQYNGSNWIPDSLSNVIDISSLITGSASLDDIIQFDGTNWTPQPLSNVVDINAMITGTPNTNDIITWTGTQWTPIAPAVNNSTSTIVYGDGVIEILSKDMSLDSVDTGVDFSTVFNVLDTIDFSDTIDGALWANYSIPGSWNTDSDINLKVSYTLDNNDIGKDIQFEVSIWISELGIALNDAAPTQTSTVTVTSAVTNELVISEVELSPILAANLIATSEHVIIKLKRIASDVSDTYTGKFQLINITSESASPPLNLSGNEPIAVYGESEIEFLPNRVSVDTVNSISYGTSFGIVETLDFSAVDDGTIWGSFSLPESWSTDSNINCKLNYSLDSIDTGNDVYLEIAYWVLDESETPLQGSPEQVGFTTIAASLNNQQKFATISLTALLAGHLTSNSKKIIFRLTRLSTHVNDTYTGLFNFISLTTLSAAPPVSTGGTGLLPWEVVSINTIVIPGKRLFVDTSIGPVSLTLPTITALSDSITITDMSGTFDINNLTFLRNGHNIMGLAEDMIVSTKNAYLTLTFSDATNGWRIT